MHVQMQMQMQMQMHMYMYMLYTWPMGDANAASSAVHLGSVMVV